MSTTTNRYTQIKNLNNPNTSSPEPGDVYKGFDSIFDTFSGINDYLLPDHKADKFVGTKIPYLYSMYGDVLINPCPIATSDLQKLVYSDATVYMCAMLTKILVNGMIKEYYHPNEEIKNLVNFSLNNLGIGKMRFYDALYSSAIYAGFGVCEKRYGFDKNTNKIIITDVAPLPPVSIMFLANNDGDIQGNGIIQYYYNNSSIGWANQLALTGSPNYPNPQARKGKLDYPLRVPYAMPVGTKKLPRRKCIHFALPGTDSATNPYGSPLVYPAYQHVVQKQFLYRAAGVGANYKAFPYPVFFVDPTTSYTLRDGTVINTAKDLAAILGRPQVNGGIIVNGRKGLVADMEVVNNTADLSQFTDLIHNHERNIINSFVFTESMIGNQEGGSYALAHSQTSVAGKYLKYQTQLFCECLVQQFAKDIIQLNYANEQDFGSFKIREDSLPDLERHMKIIESLTKFGYMSPYTDAEYVREAIANLPMDDKLFDYIALTTGGNMTAPYNTKNRGTNMTEAQRSAEVPYAGNI